MYDNFFVQMEELRSGTSTTKPKICFQDNYQNIAPTASTRYAEDAETCQKMLNGQTRFVVNFWTYQKSTKICRFKLNQTLGPFDSDWISGPKTC